MVGALGVGCGDSLLTAALVERFAVRATDNGVVVDWVIGMGRRLDDAAVQSGPTAHGPWTLVAGIRRDSATVCRLIARSNGSDGHWYRLVIPRGSGVSPIAGPERPDSHQDLGFGLLAVSPNPSDGQVQVLFRAKTATPVDLRIFDLQGRLIATPKTGLATSGVQSARWSGRDESGGAVAPGIYLVRLRSPAGVDYRRLVVTR